MPPADTSSVAESVLKELEKYTGTDEVRRDVNIGLFREKLLDSLATVELLLALSQDLGIEVAPSEIDRDLWATPAKIIEYFEARLKAE